MAYFIHCINIDVDRVCFLDIDNNNNGYPTTLSNAI